MRLVFRSEYYNVPNVFPTCHACMHAYQKIKILVKVCHLSTSVVHAYTGFSLMADGQLKNWLLRVLGRLLFQEMEDGETGT